MTRWVAAGFLMVAWTLGAGGVVRAQDGTMAMDEYIRTVCLGNEKCMEAGTHSVQERKGIIVTLAAMCHEIPRSKEEGECFQAGYGLAGVLRGEELKPTLEALGTTRDKLIRFLTAVHDDCGKRNQCYWSRLMSFEREYLIYQNSEAR